jgi:chromosome segregation ATPase
MRLDKLTLDSDAREEFLLFTAVTDDGVNIDQEQVQRLMDVSGTVIDTAGIAGAPTERLTADGDRLAQATLARASEAGDDRFRRAQTQVNQWADDKIVAAEMELEAIRRDLRAARRQSDLAETVALQQQAQERIAELEAKRRRARRRIDEVEDAVEQERQALLRQLQDRCQQHHTRSMLFTLRFVAV